MAAKGPYVEIYKDADGDWRWRAKSPNGKIVADSAEGYKRKAGAINGLEKAWAAMKNQWREVP